MKKVGQRELTKEPKTTQLAMSSYISNPGGPMTNHMPTNWASMILKRKLREYLNVTKKSLKELF